MYIGLEYGEPATFIDLKREEAVSKGTFTKKMREMIPIKMLKAFKQNECRVAENV